MDEKELIRAVNSAALGTLKKIRAIADFRLGNEGFQGTRASRGLNTDEQLFYSAIVTTLARHHAGFAEFADAEKCTRLPGFDREELRAAYQVVDRIYTQSFSETTLSRAKFYRLLAACAYKWLQTNQERRNAVRYARRALQNSPGPQNSDDERDRALRYLISVCARDTVPLNRSVKGMIKALQAADTILEESFPGYMQSGLLRMIVERSGATWPASTDHQSSTSSQDSATED